MNKQEIFQALNEQVSMSAIHIGDDGPAVVGKFCTLSPPLEGESDWELYIHNPKDLTAGLGARKLNNIINAVLAEVPTNGTLQSYEGEAVLAVPPEHLGAVTGNLTKVLGIRRKRSVSPEQLTAMQARLSEARRQVSPA